MRFNTALLHKNNGPERATGATHTPIYQSSAFEHKTAEELEAIFNNRAPGFSYTRINNPTVEAFERRVAALEGGIGAVACASGMAAISLSVLNLLSAGDEILSAAGIFGGTIGLFRDLESYGITTRYVADSTPESFENQITGRTKLIFVETIGNPKLDVPDISALSEMAHRHKIPVIVDNTAATPFLVRPIELGADIIVHSVSKYINGSGNSIGGIIVDSGNFDWDPERYPAIAKFVRFGEFAYLSKLRGGLFRNTGSCFSPFNAFLCSLGLETLGIRMERLCGNAQKLAQQLSDNPKLAYVNYPGLETSPWHQTARRQFSGGYGAILTLRAGTKENAFFIINHLKYACNIANIGDLRTLVIHPASTIYANSSTMEKENAGVYEDLIRVSVGLEDIEDLTEDFENAVGGL
ncbi:O-acetylhomoserine aminocarboxypropyltransferase/cysteine synthase family protein [Caproiciproducens sp. R1]|uniref:O-acetylhomoserine aminocarboxypropyltransferase/cysteine synthase family protein n=1 Tax=Caproiciproducens sp. R1 TaxID=3435000 RepID=UPI004033B4CD